MCPRSKKLGGGCGLNLKEANRIFNFIFNQFNFIRQEEGILTTFRFSPTFIKFCYTYKLPIIDAIHILTAMKLKINMATFDKKIQKEIPPIKVVSPIKLLEIK